MANPQPSQEDLMQFEQNRQQLIAISSQKQQLQMQSATLEKALEELEKTTEKKVYKAVGNILILSDTAETKKELSLSKETVDLRVKTLQKQEDVTIQKLNKLRAKIEGTLDETTKTETAKESRETKKSGKGN